jgi:ParB-like chromosome segregation protein Spo0J
MKLKFKDVLSNPYRDLKGNPLLKEKIAELVASINTTGFWDNVVVRKNKAGKYELAYGHHRIAAAIEAGLESADFIVKDLTDALMIQIMDNENREVYASSPASMIEAVKAVVSALATDSIEPVDVEGGNFGMRIAPSYVPVDYAIEKVEIVDRKKVYTPIAIARFLGRAVSKGENQEKPDRAIEAALKFLCLKELGKINNAVLIKDGRPISSSKLAVITTEITQRHVAEVVRQGKTSAELEIIRAKQLELQQQQREMEKKAEEAHKALVKKLADAERDENDRKTDALAKQIKENDERAKAKEALNKERMKELDKQLAAKKAWEAQQVVQDAYMSIRRDVETLITRWETKVSERDAEKEQVKALAKLRALRPEDRRRLRKAAVDVANHYDAWVAVQFAPLLTEKAELKEMKKREVAKRKSDKETK